MGAIIPQHLIKGDWSDFLERHGYNLVNQGKTRDIYDLGDQLLMVATDRLSIFEFVLGTPIAYKGEILTALTHFWLTQIIPGIPNHLANSNQYPGKNAVHDLKPFYPQDFVVRSLVINKVNILPFELIFRHHIGGSVYGKYLETGEAGGTKLPPNLPKWSRLDEPIFTTSTKEELGHDINVDADTFYAKYGQTGRDLVAMLKRAYNVAYEYAAKRGILILDTKLEASIYHLADEVFTPDSSRFCLKEDWEKAMLEKREPNFYDKQVVRDWGAKLETPFFDGQGKKIIGLKGLEPTNPEHYGWVHQLVVPPEIVDQTEKLYFEIFYRLTGLTLSEYQEMHLF